MIKFKKYLLILILPLWLSCTKESENFCGSKINAGQFDNRFNYYFYDTLFQYEFVQYGGGLPDLTYKVDFNLDNNHDAILRFNRSINFGYLKIESLDTNIQFACLSNNTDYGGEVAPVRLFNYNDLICKEQYWYSTAFFMCYAYPKSGLSVGDFNKKYICFRQSGSVVKYGWIEASYYVQNQGFYSSTLTFYSYAAEK